MGLFSLWPFAGRPPQPELLEKQLSQLQLRIERHDARLQSIRARQIGATALVTIYLLAFWLIYTLVWSCGWGFQRWIAWFTPPPALPLDPSARPAPPSSKKSYSDALEASPVFLIPTALLFLRRILAAWYHYKQESEQVQLNQLKKQQRHKLEEFKKKVAYNTTREIIERYDDRLHSQPPTSRTGRSPFPPHSDTGTPNVQSLRQRQLPPPPASSPSSLHSSASPAPPTSHPTQLPRGSPASTRPPAPSPLGKKGWADRFAQVLLGDDEARPNNQYALICPNCFAHNGLVRREELEQIQYVCPQCRTFNPAKKRPTPGSRTCDTLDDLSCSANTVSQNVKKPVRQSLGALHPPPSLQLHLDQPRRAVSMTNPERHPSHNSSLVEEGDVSSSSQSSRSEQSTKDSSN